MISFLESAGVALVAALLTACWHALSRNEKPEVPELAIGFDLLVATMVLQSGFLPGSHGAELGYRWSGLVLLFLMLSALALYLRMRGYEKSEDMFRREGTAKRPRYIAVDRMTSRAAWGTSIFGCAVLCAFWWLNTNIGLVADALKG